MFQNAHAVAVMTALASPVVAQVDFQVTALAPIVTSSGSQTNTVPAGSLTLPFSQGVQTLLPNVGRAIVSVTSPADAELRVGATAQQLLGPVPSVDTAGPVDLLVAVTVMQPIIGSLVIDMENVVSRDGVVSTVEIDVQNDGVEELSTATNATLTYQAPLSSTGVVTIPIRVRSFAQTPGNLVGSFFGLSSIEIRVVGDACSITELPLPSCGFFSEDTQPSVTFDGRVEFTVQDRPDRVEVLVLGTELTPIALPFPLLGGGLCTLDARPDLVLAFPQTGVGSTSLSLGPTPQGLAEMTLFAEALRIHTTTGVASLSPTYEIVCR